MKHKFDIFGMKIEEGDFVIRPAGTELLPCRIRELEYNSVKNIIGIVVVHPYLRNLDEACGWITIRKRIFPSQNLIRIEKEEVLKYCGDRENWEKGFKEKLLEVE